jgi:hypothetical protein
VGFFSKVKEISGCPHETPHGVSAPVLEYNKNPQALNA